MAILEIGDNFQDTLLIHKLINKIFLAGGRKKRSLSQAISDFDDYYEIFNPASVNKLDRIFFSNGKVYCCPYPFSRIHIHDLASYINSSTHIIVDELTIENGSLLFPYFEKIIFIDRGGDPRSKLVQEAHTKKEPDNYIHENYIKHLQTWTKDILMPKIRYFGETNLFGIFYEELYYAPEKTIKRLSKFLRVKISETKVIELAVWLKANLLTVPALPNWEEHFTHMQKISTHLIFREIFQGFDLPIWQKYFPMCPTQMKLIKLGDLPKKISRRRGFYQFVTNRRIVQALIKQFSKTANSL